MFHNSLLIKLVPEVGFEPTDYTGLKPIAYAVLLLGYILVPKVGVEPTEYAGFEPTAYTEFCYSGIF